jgi:hypothetical protein
MNVHVGERVEALGLDSPEARGLLYYREPEHDPLLEDMTASQRFSLLFKRVQYLAHTRMPWKEGTGKYEEQIGDIHNKTVDFAGTSLHLVLNANEYWGDRGPKPDIISAEWTSDKLDKTIASERIEIHGISFWEEREKPVSAPTLRSLALVEESVGEAEGYLGIGYRGPQLRQLREPQEQVEEEEPVEISSSGRLNGRAGLATFIAGETASVVGAVAAHSPEVLVGGTALTVAATIIISRAARPARL